MAQDLRDGFAAESGGMRRAALLVHSMAPIDQAFMLDALPSGQRAELQRLLEELKALGIERDPALIADAVGGRSHWAPYAPPFDEDRLHAPDDGEMSAMIRLMRAEPAGVVARWLTVAEWPWRERLLAGLESGHRRRVEALLAAPSASIMPPAMRDALMAAVLGGLQEHVSADVRPRSWHAIRGALESLLRGERSPGRTAV